MTWVRKWRNVSDKTLSAASEGEAARLRPTNWWRILSTNINTFEQA